MSSPLLKCIQPFGVEFLSQRCSRKCLAHGLVLRIQWMVSGNRVLLVGLHRLNHKKQSNTGVALARSQLHLRLCSTWAWRSPPTDRASPVPLLRPLGSDAWEV